MIEKRQLKAYLSRHEGAYWAAAVLYENALYPRHILRQGLAGSLLGLTRRGTRHQSLLTWDLAVPESDQRPDLISWLRGHNIIVREGGHTFYVPPQAGLQHILPSVVGFYPDQAGFKILKDFRHPSRARYLHKHRRCLGFLDRLIGSPHNQLTAANYMYSLGIGPRVWDLTCWQSRAESWTVFVVEHVSGGVPTSQQSLVFLNHLKQLNAASHLRVLIPNWERNEDFTPPDCNGNLVYSDARNRAIYVDFQNFGLTNYTSWSGEPGDTPPNTTSTTSRWAVVKEHLRSQCESIENRIVLEIGFRRDSILAPSLAEGAAWALGWYHKAGAKRVEKELLSSGMTRFSLAQVDAGCDRPVTETVPPNLRFRLNDAILLWHGPQPGTTAIDGLLRLPWKTLICDVDDLPPGAGLQGLFPSSQFNLATTVRPAVGSPLAFIERRHA